MNKKYELTDETIKYNGVKLYRIRALRNFGDVRKGDLGGFVESENNLSHKDNCWIYDNGKVMGHGEVLSNAKVFDYGEVRDHGKVLGDGKIFGHGIVKDYGSVWCNGVVLGHGEVSGHGEISHDGLVADNGKVTDWGNVWGNGKVLDNGEVSDYGLILGYGTVAGNGVLGDCAVINGEAVVRNMDDYQIFQNNWSHGKYFTWTKSDNMWSDMSFHGTGEEMVENGYKDSKESGRMYEIYVKFVEENFLH